MRRSVGSTVDSGVFLVSVIITILFVLWGVLFTDNLSSAASTVLGYMIDGAFILATFGFLALVGFLAFSRYGGIKLSIGMGIGLISSGSLRCPHTSAEQRPGPRIGR